MNRGIALLAVVVVLVGVAGIVAGGPIGTAVAQDDPVATNETGETEANETTDISPGERLSGVVAVQNAEISGEVESRAFEVGLNRTDTDAERAEFVAERLNRSEQRIEAIAQRQRELRELRDDGELSQGAYAARMAETSARAEQVRREANRSDDVARGLPETIRAERGIDDERLNTLRDRANELTGPEVAAIARGVAGDDVGSPLASGRRGPPSDVPGEGGDRPGNGTESPGGGGPPSDGGDPPGDVGDPPNTTNATRGAGTTGQPEIGGANDAGQADEVTQTDTGEAGGMGATSESDGTNDSADASSNPERGEADRSGRTESGTTDGGTGGADDASDRGRRGSSSMAGAVADFATAVDWLNEWLTETAAAGYPG